MDAVACTQQRGDDTGKLDNIGIADPELALDCLLVKFQQLGASVLVAVFIASQRRFRTAAPVRPLA